MEQSIKIALTLHVEKFHTLYETLRYATMFTRVHRATQYCHRPVNANFTSTRCNFLYTLQSGHEATAVKSF